MSSLELVPVPVSENISLWEGVSVWEVTIFSTIFSVIVLFISLWEGVSCLEMSNAFGGGVVTPLSLELVQ